MDSKELRGLMEAYSEVYAPEQIDEAVKGASRHDTEMRKAGSAERRSGVKNRLSPSAGKGYADQQKQSIAFMDKVTKKNKNVVGLVTKEELDVFDVVLEFLQAEGYAETLEEAEWMMANMIDEEAIDIIVEAMREDEDEDEEDEKEMKKEKKSKKEKEEGDEDEEEELDEATYSAKAARAGKDIGKPGKAFAKIAKSASKRYGSKERGEKVAGAVLAKLRAKRG